MKRFHDWEVVEIRSKRAAGCTQPELALEYGCSVNTIRSIEKGLSYREIGGFAEAPPDAAQASEARLRERMLHEKPIEPAKDGMAEVLSRSGTLEDMMRRLKEKEAVEHSSKMQDLKQFSTVEPTPEASDELPPNT